MKQNAAPSFKSNGSLRRNLLNALGFNFTDAQQRVVNEISLDLESTQPMQRLLQGDVGSGKTVVAACAALSAVEAGYQVALMAPTELLAEQHFKNFQGWLEKVNVRVDCLLGRHKGKPIR